MQINRKMVFSTFRNLLIYTLAVVGIFIPIICSAQVDVQNINRGVVAVNVQNQGVYIGWRLMATDPDSVGFNVYRQNNGGTPEKLNEQPLTGATNFFDSLAGGGTESQYYVTAVVDAVEKEASEVVGVWSQNYLNIPLNRPSGGTTPDNNSFTYTPNDASVADLDGDGDLEIVLKWDPTNAKDNSQDGYTGHVLLDAYEMDGTWLWRIDLGKNVRAGAHYTQFMVYDLDGDGKAEMSCRTAPGSKDATGAYLRKGPAGSADHEVDYRNGTGRIIEGPEYLTVFNGETGSEITTVAFEPARGKMSDWGDSYGNRGDRFLGAVAYLDGAKPSLVWGRGIYEKMELAAWDYIAGELTLRWHFKTQEGYGEWAGMGSHNLSVGDVDGDGRDEIVYGNAAIDDDGTGLWTLRPEVGKATGDAMHLADIMPDREGLEKFGITEGDGSPGSHLVDAKTGEILWKSAPADVGRGVSGDLVPEFYGMECWGGTDGLRSAGNVRVGNAPSSINFVVWWDGDLSRELLDGNTVRKYDYNQGRENVIFEAVGCVSNNGSKSTPSLQADILGDWREEIILRTADNNNLRIFTTTVPTEYRIKTLMHDRQYRLAIAWQNNSYNQPPHPEFYLGNDMFTPVGMIPPSSPTGLTIKVNEEAIGLEWNENRESDLAGFDVFRSDHNQDNFRRITDSIITKPTYVDTTFELDVEYFYYVIAIDTSGNESQPSQIVSAFPTNKPDPPVDIQGRNGRSKALLFWNDSPTESVTGYNVYLVSGAEYQKLNDVLIQENEYLHTGLTNGNTYQYVISSVDAEGLESYYSREISITPGREVVIQAEDGRHENVFIENNHVGFHGTGFVNFDATGHLVFDRVYNHHGGWYNLVLRYALGAGDRTGTLVVNDSAFSYTMAGTTTWDNYVYDTVRVLTKTGFENTIRIEATGSDFGNLDEILLNDQASPPEDPDPDQTLSTTDLAMTVEVYPNPASSHINIDVRYQGRAIPQVEISNLLGQRIKLANMARVESDQFHYQWGGEDGQQQRLSPGLYFLSVKAGQHSLKTMKIILQ